MAIEKADSKLLHNQAIKRSLKNNIAEPGAVLFGLLIILSSALIAIVLDWKMVLYIVAGTMILWFLLRHPAVTFALFLSAGYFKGDPLIAAFMGPLDLTLIFAIIMSLCLFWQIVIKRVSFRLVRNLWPVVAMIVFTVASLSYTPDLSYGLPKVGLLLSGVLLSLLSGSLILSRMQDLKMFLKTLVIIGFVMAIYAVAVDRTLGKEFANAFGSNYLSLGKASAVAAFVLLFSDFHKSGFLTKTLKLLLCFVLIWGLLISGGRGPVFAVVPTLAIGCFVAWIIGDRSQYRHFIFASIVITLMAAILLASGLAGLTFLDRATMVTGSLSNKTVALSGGSTLGSSASSRLLYWGASLRLLAEKPVAGVGIGGFNKAAFGERGELYPHNIFFELASELGLTGLCLFLLQLFVSWRSLRIFLERNCGKAKFSSGLILLLLIVYLLMNACLSGDLNDNRQLFGLCGAAAALNTHEMQMEDVSL